MIESIINAIATGLVSLILEKRKEKRDDKKEQNRIFKERPELEIVEFKDYISRPGYGIKKNCDIDLFVAHMDSINLMSEGSAIYHNEDAKQEEWCCAIYTLKNVGKTDISSLDIISMYKKDTCIFSSTAAKKFISEEVINYSICYDKKIRVGESVTLKMCYHKERILCGMVTANMVLGLRDINGNCWQQPLFAPKEKLYDSYMVKRAEYVRDLQINETIKNLPGPYV